MVQKKRKSKSGKKNDASVSKHVEENLSTAPDSTSSPSVHPNQQQQQQQQQKELDRKKESVLPVSSSDDDDNKEDDHVDTNHESVQAKEANVTKESSSPQLAPTAVSRLFAPFKTVGVVTSKAGFDFVAHEDSTQSFAVVPIHDRFQFISTNHLEPVMVSPSLGPQQSAQITHLLHDSNVKVTITCATIKRKGHSKTQITLWNRINVQEQKYFHNKWQTTAMIRMGNVQIAMKEEKEGKMENVVIFCVIQKLAALSEDDDINDIDNHQDVPVVGNDDSDDEESTGEDEVDDAVIINEDNEDYNESNDDALKKARGRFLVMVASRTHMSVQKSIHLTEMPNFQPTCVVHPSTYVNKICIGGVNTTSSSTQEQRPCIALYNIRSGKLVHDFQCLPLAKQNQQECTITCMEQSPAVDTIAVGTSLGDVYLINLRYDQLLFQLKHRIDNSVPVGIQSLSFRTDASALQYAIAPLAVGRSDGKITIWDLTVKGDGRREILTEFMAHPGGVSRLLYLPQEPLLLSTGTTSNSLLMHIFDNPDHSGRLLKSRKGHTSPPTHIQYLHPAQGSLLASLQDDASAHQIISSGGADRTLRVFSTVRTVFDKEYSQGPGIEKKAKQWGVDPSELLLPPVLDWASCQARSRDWGDLVTIHKNHAMAYVWSHKRSAQSGPVLRQPQWNISAMKVQPPVSAHATSVTLSACGNFCLVGTKGGTIYKYNVESGLTRGSYPRDQTEKDKDKGKRTSVPGDLRRTIKELEKSQAASNRASNLDKRELDADRSAASKAQLNAKLKSASHVGFAVTGLAVDTLNKTLISTGGDGKLILWNFTTHAPHKNSPYILPSPATKLSHIRDSDLAAIALSDYSILLFDCAALSIVRRFGLNNGHEGPITDLGFSPDGRLLYTASLDKTIRVWDVPTNTCVDWLGFKAAPTSLTVNPTGEFLATTHKGRLGISVWSDRSFYQTIHINGTAPVVPVQMDEPLPITDSKYLSDSQFDKNLNIESVVANAQDDGKNPEPISPIEKGLVTLSGLPQAHWKTLFHLELVKERNKPKEAPKKPPSAPFFLQWRSGETLAGRPEDSITQPTQKTNEVEEDEWAAAWSDEDADKDFAAIVGEDDGKDSNKLILSSQDVAVQSSIDRKRRVVDENAESSSKKRSTRLFRSRLVTLLLECSDSGGSFSPVTNYIGTLGPSSIDVELGSLCRGTHDLVEGLEYLNLACEWLVQATKSRERFEAVNAYVHRFLYLHASTIAGIEETLASMTQTFDANGQLRLIEDQNKLLDTLQQLKMSQIAASEQLQSKMQHTLCLLQHFSRMI